MYVVRRSFRNYGQMMAPGSIVEPEAVKRFKARLNDGHIVEVNEHDFPKWQKYFKERIGVELTLPKVAGVTKAGESDKAHEAGESDKAPEAGESDKANEAVSVAKIVRPATAVVKAK